MECQGKVAKDPYTNDPAVGGKKKYTAFTLVTNRYVGTNPDNTPKYESVFLNCVAFDRIAEQLAKLIKGDALWVRGDPSVDTYEGKDGKVGANMKCVVRDWDKVFIPSTTASTKNDDMAAVSGDDDDMFND
ncbi:MAG TPA: single-stranded DNA-binding protein [Methylomirabilota bacterium]|nr:single-stranded DNA-binding protein [Methylomirabilota bacterium]